MTYESNTWVNFDSYVSLIVGVWQGYYEPFDAEVVDGEARCGEKRHRQMVLRDLFDDHGRCLAGVPAMKYLEAVQDDLRPATESDLRRIDSFRTRRPDDYRRWMERDATCTDWVTLGIPVPPEKQRATLAQLRKLSRQLPAAVTYNELIAIAAEAGLDLQGCRSDYASQYEDYVCFSLFFRVGEQRDRQQLYHAIKRFDHRDSTKDARLLNDPACWFHFEHLFLFVARNVKEYMAQHPNPSLQSLLMDMKPAFLALADGKHKGNPLAKEFHGWVPKRVFCCQEAWQTGADYFALISDRYSTAPLAAAMRTAEWQQKYRWIYDVCL